MIEYLNVKVSSTQQYIFIQVICINMYIIVKMGLLSVTSQRDEK